MGGTLCKSILGSPSIMDHGSSCSHFAFFMPVVAVMCFFTVALAAKHELGKSNISNTVSIII